MYKLSAVFIGIIISFMISFNGALSSVIGNYEAVLVIHLAGLAAISIIIAIKREKLKSIRKLPPYLFLGGALGVIMTVFNNLCILNLGVSLTLAIGLFGQSLASAVIDHFGLFGMSTHRLKPKKLLGFAVVLLGIFVMTVY